jgi:uncharacterized BrkB/YihY/UPF0761 family membrane protein
LVRAIYRLGHGLVLHDVLLAAPAMAFHFFLSLLPLLVFIGFIVGLIARRRGVEAVLSPLLDNLPHSAETIVRTEVERLAGTGTTALGPAAAATFLWIASGGTHGLMNAVENVVGAPKRPWWRKRLLSVAWVISALGTFALASYGLLKWDAIMHPPESRAIVSTTPSPPPSPRDHEVPAPIIGHAGGPSAGTPSVTPLVPSNDKAPLVRPSSSAGGLSREQGAKSELPRRRRAPIVRGRGERVLALTLSVLFATAALASFYRFAVKHSKRVTRRVLPGAVLAVALWLSVSWAFGLYVNSLAEYATFYGSLAAVAVLLVWLWLTSLAILVGAELNSQLEGLRD